MSGFSTYDVGTMTGTTTGATSAGAAEDLLGVTTIISPTKTPLWSTMPKGPAKRETHDWMTDALADAAANAHVEGADYSAPTHSGRTRYRNYTQIMKKRIFVSGTQAAILLGGGISSEYAHQKMKALKELARDIEYNIWTATAAAGDATTARTMRGIEAVLGAGNVSSSGTDRNLTGALFNGAWQLAWNDGADCDVVFTTMLGKRELYALVSTSYGTRFLPSGDGRRVVQTVDIYEGELGVLKVIVTRYCSANVYNILERSMWHAAVLRAPFVNKIGNTGDSRKAEIITELTLEFRHPDAGAILKDINMPAT